MRQKLAAGTLIDGLGPVERPVTVGIGQSMGGSLTIVQQGRHHCYDGIGVLGYSPQRTLPPTAPGTPPLRCPGCPATPPWPRASSTERAGAGRARRRREPRGHLDAMAWGFHYDDIDPEVVRRDIDDYPARHGDRAAVGLGHGAVRPSRCGAWRPGGSLAEAAAVRCPVLVALGERDVLVDPAGRAAGLRVGVERRLLRVPEHGAHAQLRGDAGVVLGAHRDVGAMGTGADARRR